MSMSRGRGDHQLPIVLDDSLKVQDVLHFEIIKLSKVDRQMIFLSAQPDEFFFLWQLQLQLFNLWTLGVKRENIHVLVGFDPKRKLRHYFKELIDKNSHLALFFVYPDNRMNKIYAPAIRAHLIHQHLVSNPILSESVIFLHDSDVIFRELPDFEKLLKGDTWYLSDTRGYLDSNYVKRASSPGIFEKMCEVVGVLPASVEENDQNAGGAQYLLKNLSAPFWKKVEDGSVKIFDLLVADNLAQRNKLRKSKSDFRTFNGIQVWTAEMWALLYCAILDNRTLEISPELDFCWAGDAAQRWDATKILHYTGIVEKNNKYFQKNKYVHFPPFFDRSLKGVDRNLAGGKVVELIGQYNQNQRAARLDLTDVTFLISFRRQSASQERNLLSVVWWLSKYFKTEIQIVESGLQPWLNIDELPDECHYSFLVETDLEFNPAKANNYLIKKTTSPIVVLFDGGSILPIAQLRLAVNILRNHEADMVVPHEGIVFEVDLVFSELFERILDPSLFFQNITKFSNRYDRYFQGFVCVLRRSYDKAGLENENISGSNWRHVERIKRLKILGFVVEQIDGLAYQLHSPEENNCQQVPSQARKQAFAEYLKVCSLKGLSLRAHVKSWKR